jgi:hypothetical protein
MKSENDLLKKVILPWPDCLSIPTYVGEIIRVRAAFTDIAESFT